MCGGKAFARHLVIQRQLTKRRDVFCPLHQHQELLFHGLAHVVDCRNLLHGNVRAVHRAQRRVLKEKRPRLALGPRAVRFSQPSIHSHALNHILPQQQPSTCNVLSIPGQKSHQAVDQRLAAGANHLFPSPGRSLHEVVLGPSRHPPSSASFPLAASGQNLLHVPTAASKNGAELHCKPAKCMKCIQLSPPQVAVWDTKCPFCSLKSCKEGTGLKYNNFCKGSGRIVACNMQHLDHMAQWRKAICIGI